MIIVNLLVSLSLYSFTFASMAGDYYKRTNKRARQESSTELPGSKKRKKESLQMHEEERKEKIQEVLKSYPHLKEPWQKISHKEKFSIEEKREFIAHYFEERNVSSEEFKVTWKEKCDIAPFFRSTESGIKNFVSRERERIIALILNIQGKIASELAKPNSGSEEVVSSESEDTNVSSVSEENIDLAYWDNFSEAEMAMFIAKGLARSSMDMDRAALPDKIFGQIARAVESEETDVREFIEENWDTIAVLVAKLRRL